MLPTYEDVIRFCLEERRIIDVESGGNKESSFLNIAERVAEKIKILYSKTGIPILSHKRILDMLLTCHKKYVSIKITFRRMNESKIIKDKIEKFKEDSCSTLFDCCRLEVS